MFTLMTLIWIGIVVTALISVLVAAGLYIRTIDKMTRRPMKDEYDEFCRW